MALTREEKLAASMGALALLPWMQAPEIGAIERQDIVGQVLRHLPDYARRAFRATYEDAASRLGAVTSADVVGGMASVLEPAYYQVAQQGKYAAGKMQPLTAEERAEVARLWDAELSYAKQFGADVSAGSVSEEHMAYRAQMYGYNLRAVFNRFWSANKDTKVFRWHMHPGAEHCVACIFAAGGSGAALPPGIYRWDDLPFFPGCSPVCLTNCMCWLESADGDVGAPQVRGVEVDVQYAAGR